MDSKDFDTLYNYHKQYPDIPLKLLLQTIFPEKEEINIDKILNLIKNYNDINQLDKDFIDNPMTEELLTKNNDLIESLYEAISDYPDIPIRDFIKIVLKDKDFEEQELFIKLLSFYSPVSKVSFINSSDTFKDTLLNLSNEEIVKFIGEFDYFSDLLTYEEKKTKKFDKEKLIQQLIIQGNCSGLLVSNDFCEVLSTIKKASKSEQIRKRRTINEIIRKEFSIEDTDLINNRKSLDKFILKLQKQETLFFEKLFELYNIYFFQNQLINLLCSNNCQFKSCFNNKCSRSKAAGWCTYPVVKKCKKTNKNLKYITINLNKNIFINALEKLEENETIDESGYKVNNILELIQLTYEHELVHALIFCFCTYLSTKKNSIGNWKGKVGPLSGHSITFMSILNFIFGHTDYRYHFQRVKREDTKNDDWEPYKNLKVDFRVIFEMNNKLYNCTVIRTGGRLKQNFECKDVNELDKDYNIINESVYKLLKIPYSFIKEYTDLEGNVFKYYS